MLHLSFRIAPVTERHPVELEVSRQSSPILTQALGPLGNRRLFAYGKRGRSVSINLNVVALLQAERVDTLAGSRTARLLPHFATCILASKWIHTKVTVYPFRLALVECRHVIADGIDDTVDCHRRFAL